MKHFLLFILVFSACKPSEQLIDYEYKSEKGIKKLYNWNDEQKPLLIVIPSLHQTKLSENHISFLTKKYRVAYLPYLSSEDKLRQYQIDNVYLREQLYSDLLTELTYDTGDSVFTLLAEGFNANVISHICAVYKPKKVVLLNAWYPTINQAMLQSCFINKSNLCDSLISFLALTDLSNLSTLIDQSKTGGGDNIYGNHNLQFWQKALEYDALPKQHNYKGTVEYIFTKDCGISKGSIESDVPSYAIQDLEKVLLNAIRN